MKFKSGVKRAEMSNAIDVFVTSTADDSQVNCIQPCKLSVILVDVMVMMIDCNDTAVYMLWSGRLDGQVLEESV